MIRSTILLIALSAAALAQDWTVPFSQSFQSGNSTPKAARAPRSDDSDYQKGLQALDAQQWDRAIAAFAAAAQKAAEKGVAADASLYWKAYAEEHAGQLDQVLAEIKALRDSYPDSRWLPDAKALEFEVRAQTGAPLSPAAEQDDELKLMALNNIMQADPDKALPILQKLLAGNGSPRLKGRALFVLTQSSSPEARKTLLDVARNSANPDLQLQAIRYIGTMRNSDARKELASIYTSSSDARVKQAIIRQLSIIGAQDELWQLYQSDNSIENRQAILQSMHMRGNSSRLIEIARTEKDPRLRISAIRSLGMRPDTADSDVLVSIYQSDQNRDVRDAVINALFMQHNGKALVDLARNEKDPQMKMDLVKKMSLIHSKEVTDYMVELLK
jgi:HEAT repeat protein